MDIQRWLEDTADRAPPDRSDDIDIPEKFRDDRPAPEDVARVYRHKRKRASSDSSIIVPKRSLNRKDHVPSRSSTPNHAPRREGSVGRGMERETSSRSRSSSKHDPEKTYERRPRHKTRADRYEPKAKKQRKARHARKDKKGDPKRRKSHRTDDGGRTAGLVQSFQLKNGPKNNRLTLKPDNSAGLFKHGRASVQMTGRGGGLPDLAFNEMRFLQKPTEHQDEAPGTKESHKSKTTEQRPAQSEEISAYFNAKTAANAERPAERSERKRETTANKSTASGQRQAKDTLHANPVVELPDKPFLGFGSKGAQQLSNANHHENTSYYTWSDSTEHRSLPPSEPRISGARKGTLQSKSKTQLIDSPNHGHRQPPMKGDPAQIAGNTPEDIGPGKWIRTGRGHAQALVEVYQPHEPSHAQRDATPALQTTSQSLPRHPSSPPVLRGRTMVDTTSANDEQGSYHTSDILKVHRMQRNPSSPQIYNQHAYLSSDKENQDPESSLSIDKGLRRADAAAAEIRAFHPYAQIQPLKPESASFPELRRRPSVNDLPRIRDLNRVSHLRTYDARASPSSHPLSFQWQSPASYRPLSKAERQHWEAAAIETLADRNDAAQPNYLGDDALTWNRTSPMVATEDVLDDSAFKSGMYGHNTSHLRHRTPRSSIFEAQLNSIGPRSAELAFSDARSGLPQSRSVQNELLSERSVGFQRSIVDDELAGFWKPNVLY